MRKYSPLADNLDLEKRLLFAFVFSVPILFFLTPLVLVVTNSFSRDGIVTVENYLRFFTSRLCLQSLLNSFIVASATVVTVAPMSLLIVFFTYKRPKFKNWIRIICSMPLFFSAYIFCIALIYIYGTAGMLPLLNLCSFEGIIFANIMFFLPYLIIPLFSYFEELDPHLDEAAESLGSSGFHKFRKVTFPQVAHGFLSASLITFLLTFNQISILLALSGGSVYTLTYLLWAQYGGFQFKMADTIASICILMTLFVSALFQPILRRLKYEG